MVHWIIQKLFSLEPNFFISEILNTSKDLRIKGNEDKQGRLGTWVRCSKSCELLWDAQVGLICNDTVVVIVTSESACKELLLELITPSETDVAA